MISEQISQEEILSFQNEYIQIISYNKNFLNYIINKIRETQLAIDNQKYLFENNVKDIKIKMDQIKKKKNNLYDLILK